MDEPTTHNKILTQHGEKIASLEAGYQQVHRDVTGLSHKFDSFITNINSKFDELGKSRKPQFGVWAAWASVVVMAMALIATPWVSDLRTIKRMTLEEAYQNGLRDAKIEILMEEHNDAD